MTASIKLDKQLNLDEEIVKSLGLIKRTGREKHGSKNRGFSSVKFSVPVTSLKKITALVYKSGRCILVGANSFDDIFEACLNVSNWFEDCNIIEARITNIVATMSANKNLKLPLIHSYLLETNGRLSCENEPELFPALVTNLKQTNSKAIIFSTGVIILTGVRNLGQLSELQNEVVFLLENYDRK